MAASDFPEQWGDLLPVSLLLSVFVLDIVTHACVFHRFTAIDQSFEPDRLQSQQWHPADCSFYLQKVNHPPDPYREWIMYSCMYH